MKIKATAVINIIQQPETPLNKIMKSAFRNAVALRTLPHYHFINPHFHSLPRFSVAAVSSPPSSLVSPSKPETFRFRRRSSPLRVRYSSMTGGETDAPASMEKQFEDFRVKLDEAGSLRERIRAVVNEIESITRLMHASLLHVHQSRPLSGNKITSVGPCIILLLLLLLLFLFHLNDSKNYFWTISLIAFF